MTPEQFDAITELIRGRSDSRTHAALRQVVLEGLSVKEALATAEREGRPVAQGTLARAVRRYRDVDLLLRHVYGGAKGGG